MWGNCHGPFLTPSSQSTLERSVCQEIKQKFRDFARFRKCQTGLPLSFGIALTILFDDVVPTLSRAYTVPQRPVIPERFPPAARAMFKASETTVHESGLLFCFETDDMDLLQKATPTDFLKCMQIIDEGIKTRDEMRFVGRFRIFDEHFCLICPFFLNKGVYPHTLFATLKKGGDLPTNDMLPPGRAGGRSRKRKPASYGAMIARAAKAQRQKAAAKV